MYRDILVHVGGDAAARARLRLGAALAIRSGARLTGLHVRPPAHADPAPRRLLDEALERRGETLKAWARAAAEAFDEEVGDCRGARWRSLEGDVVEGIRRCASSADLVIVGESEWRAPAHAHPLPIAHAVIRRCGRPVLVAPDEHVGGAARRIVIGWNGSREAVRAVHDAMPLLLTAESIDIVADGAADDDGGAALGRHIVAHGGSSPPQVIVSRHPGEPRAVRLDRLLSGGHDLLVIGGSTRPAWRESIFGGVTCSILMRSKIPVLAAI
jgi:nucleotide-binding universal stress UspA family protein